MDAAKTSDDPGATSSPMILNGTEIKAKTFMPPDDYAALSKPFHKLLDAVTECLTTEMKRVKQQYEAAIQTYEERVVTWATDKKVLEGENEELKTKVTEG